MGSIGANRNTASNNSLIGKNVAELSERYTLYSKGDGTLAERLVDINKRIKEDFNIPSATEKQIDTIRQILTGLRRYDYQYDENKTPFTVDELEIKRLSNPTAEELQRDRELFGRTHEDKTLSIYIRTTPNYGNSYLNFTDQKYRHAFIGKNGGLTYYGKGSKSKRLSVSDFLIYGTDR